MHASGTIALDGAQRANVIPDPCGDPTVAEWVDYSTPVERVTSAPVPLPQRTAIHVTPQGEDGTWLDAQVHDLPTGVDPGDWLAVQATLYVEHAADDQATLWCELYWADEDGTNLAVNDRAMVVNAAYWASAEPRPWALRNALLPLAGFVTYSALVQVPTDLTQNLKPVTQFMFDVMVLDITGGANPPLDAEMWVTGVLVEASAENAAIAPYSTGSATLSAYVVPGAMRALGSLGLQGKAWLFPVAHGRESMVAHGYIHSGSYASIGYVGGSASPPAAGPPAPVRAIPDIRSLSVSAGGYPLRMAEIADLTIELTVEGGPESATLTVNSDLKRAPKLLNTLVVSYKGLTLFHGRLERIATGIDAAATYELTYAGPMVELRDHKAFRQVYVTTDLDEWQTDQGPRSSPDTFEVVSRRSGNTP
jgi:hypothetical protein